MKREMSETPTNRRKDLSIKEKLDILKAYDELPKMSQRRAATELKISQPLLCKILKNRSKIEHFVGQNENSVRKRNRGGKYREIERALKLWFRELQEKNAPINGHIIRERGKELAREMGIDFAATDGWFSRWKKRENIVYGRNVSISGGRTSERDTSENDSSSKVSQVIVKTDDTKSELYDHTELNWDVETREDYCQVSIKTENISEEEENPTDEEMLEAVKVLRAGVRHRTTDLELQYKYENFIHQLLNKDV